MRLICPNCDAQYEVSDEAIPPGGRDVQCSNCQLSWFQTEKPVVPGRDTSKLITPRHPEPTEEAVMPENEVPQAATSPRQDAAASEPEDVAEAPETDPTEPKEAEPATAKPEPEPAPQPQRRPLDDAVANILREEASLSAAPAAAAPTSAIANPPPTETSRPPTPVTVDATLQRIAKMTAEEGGTRTATQAKQTVTANASADEAHLRTVPSINEINATLRARAQANDTSGMTEVEKEEAVQRKGFRRGFFMVLTIFAILLLPYAFADQIAENLPQTTDVMGSYVMMVDQLRVSLSEMVSRLTSG